MTNSTTEPTQSIRERLAQASWKSDGVTLPYPWHAISWEDAPKNEKQPHFDSVDAILSELMEPSAEMIGEAGAKVLNKYVHADPADSYLGTAEWALECWQAMLQHIRNGGK